MKTCKTIFAALALATATLTVAAPAALAQGAIVIVIDETQILADSKAGKDMFTKLKNIETQINAELKPTRDSLETERKAIATKLEGKTREAIVADAALVKSIEGFQTKSNEFAAKEKNAQVVLSKSQAVFTAASVDATALIVSKLDQKTPAITVVRQRAPAPQ